MFRDGYSWLNQILYCIRFVWNKNKNESRTNLGKKIELNGQIKSKRTTLESSLNW